MQLFIPKNGIGGYYPPINDLQTLVISTVNPSSAGINFPFIFRNSIKGIYIHVFCRASIKTLLLSQTS